MSQKMVNSEPAIGSRFECHPHALNRGRARHGSLDADGLDQPVESRAFLLGVFVFKAEGGHFADPYAGRARAPLPRPSRRAALAASIAVFPAPTTTTLRPTGIVCAVL